MSGTREAPVTPKKAPRFSRRAQRLVNALNYAAEFANVAIGFQAVCDWLPELAEIVRLSPLAYIILVGDPLIYAFRGGARLVKLIGRKAFGLKFDEDKEKPHPHQTTGTLFILGCYAFAIALFCGAIVSPPVGITLAWTIGLMGNGGVGFFEYFWPEKQARQKWENLKNTNAPEEQIKEAEQHYLHAKKTRQLFFGVLIAISFLLICGSAAVFAPPALIPILAIASKAAGISLGLLAVTRLGNKIRIYFHNRAEEKKKKELEAAAAKDGIVSEKGLYLFCPGNSPRPQQVLPPPAIPFYGPSRPSPGTAQVNAGVGGVAQEQSEKTACPARFFGGRQEGPNRSNWEDHYKPSFDL